jgi:hypothetical protein
VTKSFGIRWSRGRRALVSGAFTPGSALVFLALGCGDPSSNGGVGTSASGAVSAPGPAASATASVSATPSAARPSEGRSDFEGNYEVKKAEIELAPGVRVSTWKKDAGDVATGTGKIGLVLHAGGRVSGTLDGPLGPATLRGEHSDATVSATITPDDPTREGSFEGTLWGTKEGETIAFQLSATTADAALVRTARGKLTQKR